MQASVFHLYSEQAQMSGLVSGESAKKGLMLVAFVDLRFIGADPRRVKDQRRGAVPGVGSQGAYSFEDPRFQALAVVGRCRRLCLLDRGAIRPGFVGACR